MVAWLVTGPLARLAPPALPAGRARMNGSGLHPMCIGFTLAPARERVIWKGAGNPSAHLAVVSGGVVKPGTQPHVSHGCHWR